MTRGRLWLLVAGALVLTLVGLGLWRRSQLIDERASAQTARTRATANLMATRHRLEQTSVDAGSLEADTAETQRSARELVGIANSIAGEIVAVQHERDDDALNAWIAGGQVSQLRECLAGITRALNEVSVGDPHATSTLGAVRQVCRAVSQ